VLRFSWLTFKLDGFLGYYSLFGLQDAVSAAGARCQAAGHASAVASVVDAVVAHLIAEAHAVAANRAADAGGSLARPARLLFAPGIAAVSGCAVGVVAALVQCDNAISAYGLAFRKIELTGGNTAQCAAIEAEIGAGASLQVVGVAVLVSHLNHAVAAPESAVVGDDRAVGCARKIAGIPPLGDAVAGAEIVFIAFFAGIQNAVTAGARVDFFVFAGGQRAAKKPERQGKPATPESL